MMAKWRAKGANRGTGARRIGLAQAIASATGGSQKRRFLRRVLSQRPGPEERDLFQARVEAALFLATAPLTSRQVAEQAAVPVRVVPQVIRQLNAAYRRDRSAFYIRAVAGGWQLAVRPSLSRWLPRFLPPKEELKLSQAAWETLAIIAYRQPIMRADIEAIRGVSCSDIIRQLIDKGLVRIVAYHHSLGRPALYGTTRYFLQVFGLPSLKHLPDAANLRRPAVSLTRGSRAREEGPSPDQPKRSRSGEVQQPTQPQAAQS